MLRPRCRSLTTHLLDASSQVSQVTVYHCERCDLVWKQPKDGKGPVDVVAAPDG